jgi:hypothetical protein
VISATWGTISFRLHFFKGAIEGASAALSSEVPELGFFDKATLLQGCSNPLKVNDNHL